MRSYLFGILLVINMLASGLSHAQNVPVEELFARYRSALSEQNFERAAQLALQLAERYENDKNTDYAIEYYLKAAEHFSKTSDRIREAGSYQKAGLLDHGQGDFLVAIFSYNKALGAYRTADQKRPYNQVLIQIGDSFVGDRKYKEAANSYVRAAKMAQDNQFPDLELDAYEKLYQVFEKMGNKDQALIYYRKFTEAAANIRSEDLAKAREKTNQVQESLMATEANLNRMQSLLRSKEEELKSSQEEKRMMEELNRLKQVEIEALERERRLKDLELKESAQREETQRLLRNLSLVAIVLGAIFIAWLISEGRRRKRVNRQLRIQTNEIIRQKEEIEQQKEQLELVNTDLQQRQQMILAQKAEIDKIVVSLEQANREITEQKEELELQKSEVERSYDNIRTISLIGQQITATLDAEDLMRVIHSNISRFMEVSVFAFGYWEPGRSSLRFSGIDETGTPFQPFEIAVSEGEQEENPGHPAVKALKKGVQVLIADLRTSRKYPERTKFFATAPQPSLSAVFLPLIAKDEKIGVMTVQSYQAAAYNRFHISMLQTLASYASIALQNISSFRQLEEAKHTIELNNRSILDSIRYAERIQRAILPNEQVLSARFPESFVLYRPKDIVSGDFYWFRSSEKQSILAVADCTGHGVPGAFMSMIGSILMEEVINQTHAHDPAIILQELHRGIRYALQQQQKTNEDGMDVCLCMFEENGQPGKTLVKFAGAKRPLFVVSNGEVQQIGGDRKSIGGRQVEPVRQFTPQQFWLNKGDTIYLTTDGFADQNNPRNEKFGVDRFRELLASVASLPLPEQKHTLEVTLDTYQKGRPQRDDITVIGVRI